MLGRCVLDGPGNWLELDALGGSHRLRMPYIFTVEHGFKKVNTVHDLLSFEYQERRPNNTPNNSML